MAQVREMAPYLYIRAVPTPHFEIHAWAIRLRQGRYSEKPGKVVSYLIDSRRKPADSDSVGSRFDPSHPSQCRDPPSGGSFFAWGFAMGRHIDPGCFLPHQGRQTAGYREADSCGVKLVTGKCGHRNMGGFGRKPLQPSDINGKSAFPGK